MNSVFLRVFVALRRFVTTNRPPSSEPQSDKLFGRNGVGNGELLLKQPSIVSIHRLHGIWMDGHRILRFHRHNHKASPYLVIRGIELF